MKFCLANKTKFSTDYTRYYQWVTKIQRQNNKNIKIPRYRIQLNPYRVFFTKGKTLQKLENYILLIYIFRNKYIYINNNNIKLYKYYLYKLLIYIYLEINIYILIIII